MTFGQPGLPYQIAGQEDNVQARQNLIDNLQIEEGYGLAKRFEQTWSMNPFPLLMNSAGLAYEEMFGSKNKITAQEANERYSINGILKFENSIDEDVALRRMQLKQAEIDRRATIELFEQQKSNPIVNFSVDMAASILDPLNIASMFIPVVGEARAASLIGSLGKIGGRAAIGAIDGFVGAAILEPFVLAGAKNLDYEYSGMDSLLNLTFGTVLGGGAHVGFGAISDAISKGYISKTAHEKALRTAISQLVTEDKKIQVEPILKADLMSGQKENDLVYQNTIDSIFNPAKKQEKINEDFIKVDNNIDQESKVSALDETIKKSKESIDDNQPFMETLEKNKEIDDIINDTVFFEKKLEEMIINNPETKLEFDAVIESKNNNLKFLDDFTSGLRQAVICLTNKS